MRTSLREEEEEAGGQKWNREWSSRESGGAGVPRPKEFGDSYRKTKVEQQEYVKKGEGEAGICIIWEMGRVGMYVTYRWDICDREKNGRKKYIWRKKQGGKMEGNLTYIIYIHYTYIYAYIT